MLHVHAWKGHSDAQYKGQDLTLGICKHTLPINLSGRLVGENTMNVCFYVFFIVKVTMGSMQS